MKDKVRIQNPSKCLRVLLITHMHACRQSQREAYMPSNAKYNQPDMPNASHRNKCYKRLARTGILTPL